MAPPDTASNEDQPNRTWEMLSGLNASVAAAQATLNAIKDDQGALRRNMHDLRGDLTPLMGLPEQMREMREQHRELKTQMADVAGKIAVVGSLTERVGKLEPVVETLVADRNQARGATWAGRVIAAIIGALVTALAWMGFIKHP